MFSEGKRNVSRYRCGRLRLTPPCRIATLFGIALLVVAGCSTSLKLSYMKEVEGDPMLALSKNDANFVPEVKNKSVKKDTITIKDLTGRDVLVMKAVKDESTGEMVASDVLEAAVVTARFRNVAERGGKVDIAFLVKVPNYMQDSRWQLRLQPEMYILGDTLKLDRIIITGNEYRKAQLRGYQLYDRFVSRIITDTTKFINKQQLEYFLQRNLPKLYALKDSNEEFTEDQYLSMFGVCEQQAIDHYTYMIAKMRNERRKMRQGEMFGKYVKAPLITEGIRLDSVVVDPDGDFLYNYVQTIKTRPKLRKVEVVLSGALYEQEKQVYSIPKSEPLTFYISSISTLADKTEHYKMRVISRRAQANTECQLDFEQGKFAILQDLGNNTAEINSIKKNLRSLIVNEEFDLDSIIVAATASPEGSWQANKLLAQKRSEAACNYFSKFTMEYRDSLKREEGISYNLDETYQKKKKKQQNIRFQPRCIPENWEDLAWYINNDAKVTPEQRQEFEDSKSISDPDVRENSLKKSPWYKTYVMEKIYPKLRTVKFNFYLHRKGMVKDTIHTTELDKVYMKGVQALTDMDYEAALNYLAPYQDFNTAIAYIGLDRNKSALQILEKLEPTAQIEYLMAIICSRLDNPQAAVDHYMNACRMNSSYIHRGNLDPEISVLIKQYELNKILDPIDENNL